MMKWLSRIGWSLWGIAFIGAIIGFIYCLIKSGGNTECPQLAIGAGIAHVIGAISMIFG